jgi:CheY-like chemotaxis protein
MSEAAAVFPLWDEPAISAACRRFPAVDPAAPQPRARPLARVLIVDDNPDARDVYAMYFRRLDYDALTAHDATTAMSMSIDLEPDVIVMDLAMPGTSGISVTHHHAGPRTRNIKVILLTGHDARAIQGARSRWASTSS